MSAKEDPSSDDYVQEASEIYAWLVGRQELAGQPARDKIFDRAHETKVANLSYAAEILRNRPELCNGFCYGIFSV
jgi:hypothetical protein